MATRTLSRGEVRRVVNRYIGVAGGYLGDFSYRTHAEFYVEYCDLDSIDPYELDGTTRERFIHILESASPREQARILRGVVEKYPVGSSVPSGSQAERSENAASWILGLADELEGGTSVANPSPAVASESVGRALRDAETLLGTSGAASALDRVHTALHGYMRALCDETNLEYASDPSITQLYKKLRTEHPAVRPEGAHSERAQKILLGLATAIDSLNAIRNQGSLAHANEELIGEPEALLAINAARSIFIYLDGKVRSGGLAP